MPFTAKFLVNAAVDYTEMFRGVLNLLNGNLSKWLYSDVENEIGHEIKWAETVLKKNYRIVWWLRWFKLALLKKHLQTVKSGEYCAPDIDIEECVQRYTAFYEKELRKFDAGAAKAPSAGSQGSLRPGPTLAQMERLQLNFKHYFDLAQIAEIQDYPLDFQNPTWVHTTFYHMEQAYNEKIKEEKRWLAQNDEHEIVLEFPNGWAWLNLNADYCREEADSMGHCGTAEDGSTLLSLREPRKMPDGSTRWLPHLTFELDENGGLRQMKGRNNEKPQPKYHIYVTALLKNPIVKRIIGGGYRPETNFALKDLTESERQEVCEAKPVLLPLREYFAKYGIDDTLIQSVKDVFAPDYGHKPLQWDATNQNFRVAQWDNLADLIKDKGNDAAEYVWSICIDDGGLDPQGDPEYVWDNLKSDVQEKIGKILGAKYPDEIRSFLEDQGSDEDHEFDPNDSDEVYEFIKYLDEGVLEALRYAADTGERHGTEKEMWEALKSELSQSGYEPLNSEEYIDGPWVSTLSMREAVEYADDGLTFTDLEENTFPPIKLREPYNGWSDYDDVAALEAFHEYYDVDAKYNELFGEKKEAPETEEVPA